MQIKAAVFDIDGTLVPVGASAPSARTLAALCALRQRGVAVILATGRALFAAQAIADSAAPDYYVAACGNLVADANGRALAQNTFTQEEMYALVDFCEDYELPMAFAFEDGYYAYVEHERLREYYGPFDASLSFLHGGENQTRHLKSMPYGASGVITPQQAEAFTQRYAHFGIRFVPFAGDFCDILRRGVSKAEALTHLLERIGITWAQTAAFGDGANDKEMLAEAGFAVAMENGSAALREIATVIAPDAAQDGVAEVIERYFLL